jgi:Na+/H+ antiporter NhaC
MDTDPKLESIELDTATQAFFQGIKYIRNYLIFICLLVVTIILIDKLELSRLKEVDKETIEFVKQILSISYDVVIWIFVMLVGSYIFKGKGGSKFFEAIGSLLEKATKFYESKAKSKFGINDKDNKHE